MANARITLTTQDLWVLRRAIEVAGPKAKTAEAKASLRTAWAEVSNAFGRAAAKDRKDGEQ